VISDAGAIWRGVHFWLTGFEPASEPWTAGA
jgi:hypothetical protein